MYPNPSNRSFICLQEMSSQGFVILIIWQFDLNHLHRCIYFREILFYYVSQLPLKYPLSFTNLSCIISFPPVSSHSTGLNPSITVYSIFPLQKDLYLFLQSFTLYLPSVVLQTITWLSLTQQLICLYGPIHTVFDFQGLGPHSI